MALHYPNTFFDLKQQATFPANIQKKVGENISHEQDILAVEEPLEIRLGFENNSKRSYRNISVTMRTPGDDLELAAGFLFTEGIIDKWEDIDQIYFCGPNLVGAKSRNVIRVELKSDVQFDFNRMERHFYTTSSCGVCGKTSIEAVKTQNKYCTSKLPRLGRNFETDLIQQLPQILSQSQKIFALTGGLHASALINFMGEVELLREDVGRHNAMDKVIGAAVNRGMMPLNDYLIFVSGRASFELVQKALMAGLRIIAAVGAPSSLAVELAREFDLTLIGFIRDNGFNIYHGAWRIK